MPVNINIKKITSSNEHINRSKDMRNVANEILACEESTKRDRMSIMLSGGTLNNRMDVQSTVFNNEIDRQNDLLDAGYYCDDIPTCRQ